MQLSFVSKYVRFVFETGVDDDEVEFVGGEGGSFEPAGHEDTDTVDGFGFQGRGNG